MARFERTKTFQIDTPGMVHVFLETKDFAQEFLNRLSLNMVHEKIQVVESSELTIDRMMTQNEDTCCS